MAGDISIRRVDCPKAHERLVQELLKPCAVATDGISANSVTLLSREGTRAKGPS
jgi:hypothetical protein